MKSGKSVDPTGHRSARQICAHVRASVSKPRQSFGHERSTRIHHLAEETFGSRFQRILVVA